MIENDEPSKELPPAFFYNKHGVPITADDIVNVVMEKCHRPVIRNNTIIMKDLVSALTKKLGLIKTNINSEHSPKLPHTTNTTDAFISTIAMAALKQKGIIGEDTTYDRINRAWRVTQKSTSL